MVRYTEICTEKARKYDKYAKTCKYIASGMLFGIIIGIRPDSISLATSLVSLSYIWVSIWSVKILGEKINTLKWLGMGLIIIGVSLIGLSA